MIFHDAKAKFKKGHIYYICGQSGVGKSTLLQLISGQLRNYKGTIKYNDSKPSRDRHKEHFRPCFRCDAGKWTVQ